MYLVIIANILVIRMGNGSLFSNRKCKQESSSVKGNSLVHMSTSFVSIRHWISWQHGSWTGCGRQSWTCLLVLWSIPLSSPSESYIKEGSLIVGLVQFHFFSIESDGHSFRVLYSLHISIHLILLAVWRWGWSSSLNPLGISRGKKRETFKVKIIFKRVHRLDLNGDLVILILSRYTHQGSILFHSTSKDISIERNHITFCWLHTTNEPSQSSSPSLLFHTWVSPG